jgi:hypothetical protein
MIIHDRKLRKWLILTVTVNKRGGLRIIRRRFRKIECALLKHGKWILYK